MIEADNDAILNNIYIYCPQKVGDIGTLASLKIKILICRINNFVFS